MADFPSVTREGQTWDNLLTAGKVPTILRNSAEFDQAVPLTYLTRQWSPFTWWLHKNVPKAKTVVKDRVYWTAEIDELDRYYTVTNPSGTKAGDTFHEWIGVPNNEAVQMQPNDLIYPKGIFATVTKRPMVLGQVYEASGGIQGTNVGPDMNWSRGDNPTGIIWTRQKGVDQNGLYHMEEEQIQVEFIDAPNSAGTGRTWIKLKRAFMGPGANDLGGAMLSTNLINSSIATQGANNGPAQIKQGDLLFRAMPAYLEGTNYPEGVFKNPTRDMNFTQLFKYAVSKTKESDIVTKNMKEKPWDIHKWLMLQRMNRDREWANLLGRKGKVMGSDGRELYVSGGVREYIPKDKDHQLVYPHASLSYVGLLDMTKPILELNGSGNYWGVTGLSLNLELIKAYANDTRLVFNKEESKKYGMEVNTLVMPGIEIKLIVSQIFEEAGYGNELMLLDMGDAGDSFQPVTNEGWDYKLETDIAAKGSNIYKEGTQGMFGLRRRKASKHAIIDFSRAVSI